MSKKKLAVASLLIGSLAGIPLACSSGKSGEGTAVSSATPMGDEGRSNVKAPSSSAQGAAGTPSSSTSAPKEMLNKQEKTREVAAGLKEPSRNAPSKTSEASKEGSKGSVASNVIPKWIWASKDAKPDEVAYFRKTFDIAGNPQDPAKGVKSAVLWGSCDNEMQVYINGQIVAKSEEWERPTKVDVKKQLEAGKNAIAVYCKNDGGNMAGLLLRLTIEKLDGSVMEIATDESWIYHPNAAASWNVKAHDESLWKPATVLGSLGMQPWGDLPTNIPMGAAKGGQATPAEQLALLPGFKAELLHNVSKASEGSWVSMTTDPKGRLIVSAQDGPLFRVTPGADMDSTQVEKLTDEIGHAQGLLYAFDSLYVVVNGGGMNKNSAGLYRLKTTDGEKYDKPEKLIAFPGRTGGVAGGEHGPHTIRLGPDNRLYIVAGNFTGLPQGTDPKSPYHNYAEDLLLPRNPDGGGHDPTIWAPAGFIISCDQEGKNIQQLLGGLRNSYDFAFNTDNEIFIYDSDMEWDTGTPWYRPTRLLMGASGGEYGWRNGTGKWPDYYPDSLPPVANTGLGSPTGVTFGYGAKFPGKYQHALYLNDWAYGKIYAAHIFPDGAGYRATFEPFVSAKGFDVTDIVVNPKDGAMYITIGGRGTQSGLYRVTYTGGEPTSPSTPMKDQAAAEARQVRHALEAFHVKQDAQAVNLALEHIGSRDRYLRFAARVALENQPLEQWQEKALTEKAPTALTNALVGLIRASCPSPDTGAKAVLEPTPGPAARDLQPRILSALNQVNLKALTEEQMLELLRAYALCFIRIGRPDTDASAAVLHRLEPLYPAQSVAENHELVQLLVYLNSPSVVTKSLDLMKKARTQEEALHYILTLRVARSGWNMDQRKEYFTFLNTAEQQFTGGASFKRFLQRIRKDAMDTLSPEETAALEPFLKSLPTKAIAGASAPRQFVRNWQMADLLPDIDQATHGRDFQKGKEAFAAAQCAACHRFGNEGGATGPDLTGVGNRFAPPDVLEAILQPSKVISDQYQTTEIVTKDDQLVGRIEAEDDQKVTLVVNMLTGDTVTIPKSQIKTRRISKLSLMPEGLVDNFTKEEILDLIAYLRSGGDPKDKAFAK